MIPVSVIMMTKNEEQNIVHTLPPLMDHFDDVHVLDSNSTDNTQTIAQNLGATITKFSWNGQYPKKKQWGIDHLPLRHEWILQIDADEHITMAFISELRQIDFSKDGYFIPAKMIWNGKQLNHGMRNKKLCLYKKSAFTFPVINDLNSPGGWEVEGHYQPLPNRPNCEIGTVQSYLWHADNRQSWLARHKKYAQWEYDMNRNHAWPNDPVWWRNMCKKALRHNPLRPFIIFIYGYIFKCGFLDGRNGFDYATCRARYTWWIINGPRY